MNMSKYFELAEGFDDRWSIIRHFLYICKDSRNIREMLEKYYREDVLSLLGHEDVDAKTLVESILLNDLILVGRFFADRTFGIVNLHERLAETVRLNSLSRTKHAKYS